MKLFWEFGHVTQLGQLNWGIWFLKAGCFQAGDQAARRPLRPSYTRYSTHKINVILDRALILCPNFWYVAEKQPAWADQRSYSQTRHALLAHRHSYPWAATGAAGLPLQEVQHRQTGAVPQIPHCPWCCGKPLLFRSIAKVKTGKPTHVRFSLFLSQVLAYQLPRSTSLKTLQGSNLSVSCGDNREIVSLHSAGTLTPCPCCRTHSCRPHCACAQPPERVSDTKTQLVFTRLCQQPQNQGSHPNRFSKLDGLQDSEELSFSLL